MARIETYPQDGNISVNDYVIGTDGDSLNATKNYKVLTFLDYLGTMYNLNSTDLLFNYNNVAAGSVQEGQVSTNNFADGTILMSGVTNIYVSKISAFGQLVDEILNTIGSEELSIMFTDMGNRNNLGIFTAVSAVDVDANTINLTVTATTTVGSIDVGKVMGVRLGVGGAGVSGNFVTMDTTQVGLTGNKTWEGYHFFKSGLQVGDVNVPKSIYFPSSGQPVESSSKGLTMENIDGGGSRTGFSYFNNDESNGKLAWRQFVNFDIQGWTIGRAAQGNSSPQPTVYYDYTLQEKSGIIAHLDDVPTVSGAAYDAALWDGNNDVPTKNAVRDVIEGLDSGVPTEGSWVCTVVDAGGGATYSFTQTCHYIRTGNLVHVYVNLTTWVTTGTPSGIIEFSMPFNCLHSFQPLTMGQLFYGSGGSSSPTSQVVPTLHSAGSDKVRLIEFPSTTNLQNKTFTSNGFIRFSGTYIAQPL